MKINTKAISDKVKNYVNSPKSKNIIQQSMNQNQMISISRELVEIIKNNLPPSISGDSIGTIFSAPHIVGDKWRIEINFNPESVFRNSLLNDGDSGYGVDNIIALLNNGYHAKRQVYGYWQTAGRNVWSRQDREALGFMQKAIDIFNDEYGSVYNCTAQLSEKYEY